VGLVNNVVDVMCPVLVLVIGEADEKALCVHQPAKDNEAFRRGTLCNGFGDCQEVFSGQRLAHWDEQPYQGT